MVRLSRAVQKYANGEFAKIKQYKQLKNVGRNASIPTIEEALEKIKNNDLNNCKSERAFDSNMFILY